MHKPLNNILSGFLFSLHYYLILNLSLTTSSKQQKYQSVKG